MTRSAGVGQLLPRLALGRLDRPARFIDPGTIYGRPYVLTFWASWCAPCRDELHALRDLRDREGRFELIAINMGEDQQSVQRGIGVFGLDSTDVALDESGAAAHALGVSRLPTTFVVGLDGRIEWRAEGYNAAGIEELTRNVQLAWELRRRPF